MAKCSNRQEKTMYYLLFKATDESKTKRGWRIDYSKDKRFIKVFASEKEKKIYKKEKRQKKEEKNDKAKLFDSGLE